MLTAKGAPTLSLNYGRRLFIVGALLFGALVFFPTVHAQGVPNPSGADINFGLGAGADFQNVGLTKNEDLKSTVVNVINWFLGILGVVAVILLLYAGFLWMTAGGREDQITKAKLIIRNALIGLAVVFLAWGIVAFVISQLRSVSDTGSGAGDGGGGGGDCTGGGCLPADRFTLQELQTAHFGSSNRDDVALCSPVQPRFNHWLSLASVALARADIKAIQTAPPDAAGTEIFLALDPIAEHVGANAMQLKGAVNWPQNSSIEIQIPKNITDQSAAALADCTALGCNDRGAYYAWTFTTTDKIDKQQPRLVSSYPVASSDSGGYPDRNVNRSLTFVLNFSEVVDFFSLTETVTVGEEEIRRLKPGSVLLSQIASRTDMEDGTLIPVDHLDVALAETGIRFYLNQNHQSAANEGSVLEAFAWYRLTINNIQDLCGNSLSEEPVSWVFQTNGNLPGVAFTYPSDGYQFACPATETFVQFRTSMYDIKTGSCAVDPAHPENGGLVTGGSGVGARLLTAVDPPPVPGEGEAAVDVNQFCKRYDFAPQTAELAPNTTYNPSVDYRNQANDSQIEQASWSFGVKPASGCANAPYISRVSPGEGPWGRCVTVSGNYFGGSAARGGGDAYLHLDLDSIRNNWPAGQAWPESGLAFNIADSNWFETYLTGTIPAVTPAALVPLGTAGAADFKVDAERSVTLGGVAQVLTSNTAPFVLRLDEPAYQGPCLTSLAPASGGRGLTVALSGTNFGANEEVVSFTNRTLGAAIVNWASAAIRAIVPALAQDGLVHVETPQGVSNGLPFDVAVGAGGSCAADADCVPGLVCLGGICVQPPASDRFEIRNPQPAASCTDSCVNAAISFETNKNINPATISEDNIKLLQCADANCASGTDIPSGVAAPPTLVNRVEISKALLPNKWYQVTILGGATGLSTPSGELLAGPSYSWKFKTGSAICGVDRIDLSPTGGILYSAGSYEYRARAYSISSSCAAAGQPLNNISFTWGDAARTATGTAQAECSLSDESRLSLTPLISTATTTAAVATFASGDRLEHLAWVCASEGSVAAGAPVTLKPRCSLDSDCVAGACAAECNQQTRICEPKITGFLPADGAIGAWVTVNGCYLGNDWGEVKFNGVNAVLPDNNFCGNTWSNTQIIAEVAPGSTSGLVEVKRLGDGRTANSHPNFFTISSNIHPALCRLSPTYGPAGAAVSLFGKNFGSQNPATDKVLFLATSTAESFDVLNIEEWIDTGASAIIRIAAPVVSRLGDWAVRVIKGLRESNPVNFNVTAGAGPGAGVEPLTVRSYMPGPGRLACPAMMVDVEFNGAIDPRSVTADVFRLHSVDTDAAVPGELQLYRPAENLSRLRFVPEADLSLSGRYEIVLNGGEDGLRSATGGRLSADGATPCAVLGGEGQCVIDFSVISRDNIRDQADCLAQSLTIEPPDPVFFCAGENNCAGDTDPAPGHQRVFSATPLSKNGQPLNLRDAVYNWASAGTQIIDFAAGSGQTASTASFIIKPQNGSAQLAAGIPAANLSGATEVRVLICKNPWPANAPDSVVPFRDTGVPYTDKTPYTNFSSFYCRDQGQPGRQDDDLPALTKQAEIIVGEDGRAVPDLVKELFFLQNVGTRLCQGGDRAGAQCAVDSQCGAGRCVGQTDAFGIRVLRNPEHFSIKEWYNRQSLPKGNPEMIKVDGYEALRDGRTVYVGAGNDSNGQPAGGPIYTNVYLLSYNDEAHADTVNIFNQLVENWRFAVNLDNSQSRDALRRDALRLADARFLADALEATTGAVPRLLAGTFQQGLSLSVWPSWAGTLAAELGSLSLPVDPTNEIHCPSYPSLNQTTCWDKNKSPLQFQCEADSHYYLYKNLAGSGLAIFQFNLEYGDINDWDSLEAPWNKAPGFTCANLEYIKHL